VLKQPAIDSGIPADRYDDMTYLEIVAQIKANRKQHLEQLREQAVMDHTQASLMAFALNDPQKMPSVAKAYPFISDNGEALQSNSSAAVKQPEPQPAWQNDQAMLLQQSMIVKATLERKKALAKQKQRK
jgi:hypothetical protein